MEVVVCMGSCWLMTALSTYVEARLRRCDSNPGHGVVREGQGRGNHHGNQGKPVHHSQDVSAGEKTQRKTETMLFYTMQIVVYAVKLSTSIKM